MIKEWLTRPDYSDNTTHSSTHRGVIHRVYIDLCHSPPFEEPCFEESHYAAPNAQPYAPLTPASYCTPRPSQSTDSQPAAAEISV